ncbi:tetratricopeptide repeat protein [Oceanobacillus alkalisoli]|uniref:tetratricopeptide repeat protein n=1 Tax=Oceanobacillus alkalisoli TaxID=2925113 RepID=UPI001EE48839|nr:tetratricopeptide repeat protein [Oceanobacillus alkalisoli]MCG5102915.1 tetratricopeptide repeat protein [Oceanobacillus alkalisoli]
MDTILQAVELVEQNKIPQALRLLEEYAPKANDDEKYTIAELYLQWGFLDEAELILSELLMKYPVESDLILSLADIAIEKEDDEKAIARLAEIPEEDPAYIQVLIQLADLYQVQGLFEVAEQKLLTAKQKLPNEVIIDFALGELSFSTGEYKKAVTYYEKVAKEHNMFADVSVLDRLAESYAGIGEYEKALGFFKDGQEQTPDKYFKYGVTASQAGRNDIAVTAWQEVVELDPYYHSVYENLAKALQNEGMVQEAFEVVEKGLKQDTFNKQLYFLAGTIARQLNNDSASEEYIREAIAIDPDYKEAILFFLEFLKEGDRHTDIIDLLESVKSIGSLEPLYDWELARAHNEEEQYKEALHAYQDAYTSLNDDTDFLKEYGYFLTEEGLVSEAITVFRKYLQHVPDDYTIEEYLSRLHAQD